MLRNATASRIDNDVIIAVITPLMSTKNTLHSKFSPYPFPVSLTMAKKFTTLTLKGMALKNPTEPP